MSTKEASSSGVDLDGGRDRSKKTAPVEQLQTQLESWDEKIDRTADPNLPDPKDEKTKTEIVVEEGLAEAETEEEENSPYPEVRAAVPNYDTDVPANTIRAWTLGLLLSVIGAAVNTLFSLRNPNISVGLIEAQLLSYFLGNLWAKVLPNKQHTTFGIKWNLSPGPFNVKEHTIIIVMASVSYGVAYATDMIVSQVSFYKRDFGLLFQFLFILTTQSLGYGIAGMLRKYLVWPAAMIWPDNLVGVSLMHAMHEGEMPPDPTIPKILGGSMSRYKWFGIMLLISFVYYFIPGFLAQFLSVFAFMTWIYPNNPVVNQLFGGTTGLSIIPITFDWTQVTGYLGSPLATPWHAIANTLIGLVVFFIFGTIGFHYGDVFYAKYLPISDSSTYDNTGAPYNISLIVTEKMTLDEAAYKQYSPLFLSTTFAICYGLSFATIASLVVHVYLHHREQVWRQFKTSTVENPDVHAKMMTKYKECPNWWYQALFALMIGLSFVTVLAYPTEFAWWAFLLAIFMSWIFTLPVGIVQAITNQQVGLNVITELVMGYLQPGRPLAVMMFKTYGYITMSQALGFVSDLKFGHYMKIPPRTMFHAQVVATVVACVVQTFVLNFAFNNIEGICTEDQSQKFSCPGGKVFFSASIIWGLLGPQRIFSPGQVYGGLLWFFPVGMIVPVIFWYVAKKWPRSGAKYLMAPVIFGGTGYIPPATPLNYLTWVMVGFVFQKYIRSRYWNWWSRLNYITSVGLDAGLAIATLFIFFAFTLPGVNAPDWWGNTAIYETMDMQGTAIRATVAPGEHFGPDTW